jgi:hypothetical protein
LSLNTVQHLLGDKPKVTVYTFYLVNIHVFLLEIPLHWL